jgi:hypothetical protein
MYHDLRRDRRQRPKPECFRVVPVPESFTVFPSTEKFEARRHSFLRSVWVLSDIEVHAIDSRACTSPPSIGNARTY